MENKGICEIENFETVLRGAKENPSKFFAEIETKYSQNEINSLNGYFLLNSNNYNLVKETLIYINKNKNPKIIDALIDFLMKEDFTELNLSEIINLKSTCISVISNFHDRACIPALLYCLNNKNANYKMRFLAAEALGKIGDKTAVDSLINVVSDEDEKSVYVRESAAVALGMIGDMRAVDPFLHILEGKKSFLDKFTFLKERVIEALSKINVSDSKKVISAFKNALDDESPQVRINAIEGLMNSECDEAYDIIKTKIYDEDEEVIQNAVIALYNLKGKEALFEILKDEKSSNIAKKEADKIYEEYEENE